MEELVNNCYLFEPSKPKQRNHQNLKVPKIAHEKVQDTCLCTCHNCLKVSTYVGPCCMSDNDCHKHIEQNITNNVMLDYNWKIINASNDKEQVKKHQPAWKALQRKWIVMLSNWIYEAFLEK